MAVFRKNRRFFPLHFADNDVGRVGSEGFQENFRKGLRNDEKSMDIGEWRCSLLVV
jgi:hypothetical protein